MSDVIAEDVDAAVTDPAIPWDELRGATALVTGATGVIGTALTRVLRAAGVARDLELTVLAHGRDPVRGRRLQDELGVRFLAGDVRELTAATSALPAVDIIFHAAAVTASARMVAEPDEVVTTGVQGTRNVLELARAVGARSVVHVSSMEVYGQGCSGIVTERALGTLDPADPRTSYPRSKREAEALIERYAARYGLRTVNARLALTFGAGVPDDPANTRVPLQFARAALAGRDIELHTDGAGLINVCDLGDAVRALVLLAIRGGAGEAYNVANPGATMTVREMAEVVARDVACGAIGVVVDPPADLARRGYAPPSSYRLSIDKLAALGWRPRHGMAQMYERMLAGWRSATR